MDEKQFCELMGKLEEIRCGIIDVEDSANIKEGKNIIDQIREAFFY